jgi:hypothetical protein
MPDTDVLSEKITHQLNIASQDPLTLARQLAEEFASTATERDERGGTAWHERDRIRQSGLLRLLIPASLGGLGSNWPTALRKRGRQNGVNAGKECSIGFQPVSGRLARHPRKSVIHGTGTTQLASAHVDKKTGWKPILQCVAASLQWVRGWRHREDLGIPLDAPKRNVAWASSLYPAGWARHPQTTMIHGTGTNQLASAHVDEKTGWKPILQCAAMGAREAPPGRPWDTARRSEAQCSIGFQPVSGRLARHPQKSVVHGTGITRRRSQKKPCLANKSLVDWYS